MVVLVLTVYWFIGLFVSYLLVEKYSHFSNKIKEQPEDTQKMVRIFLIIIILMSWPYWMVKNWNR